MSAPNQSLFHSHCDEKYLILLMLLLLLLFNKKNWQHKLAKKNLIKLNQCANQKSTKNWCSKSIIIPLTLQLKRICFCCYCYWYWYWCYLRYIQWWSWKIIVLLVDGWEIWNIFVEFRWQNCKNNKIKIQLRVKAKFRIPWWHTPWKEGYHCKSFFCQNSNQWKGKRIGWRVNHPLLVWKFRWFCHSPNSFFFFFFELSVQIILESGEIDFSQLSVSNKFSFLVSCF